MTTKIWPSKDPNEVLDYGINWTSAFNDVEIIASSIWETPSGLIVVDEGWSDRASVIWLAGGTDGTAYTLVNRVTTTEGRVFDQSVKLRVRSK